MVRSFAVSSHSSLETIVLPGGREIHVQFQVLGGSGDGAAHNAFVDNFVGMLSNSLGGVRAEPQNSTTSTTTAPTRSAAATATFAAAASDSQHHQPTASATDDVTAASDVAEALSESGTRALGSATTTRRETLRSHTLPTLSSSASAPSARRQHVSRSSRSAVAEPTTTTPQQQRSAPDGAPRRVSRHRTLRRRGERADDNDGANDEDRVEITIEHFRETREQNQRPSADEPSSQQAAAAGENRDEAAAAGNNNRAPVAGGGIGIGIGGTNMLHAMFLPILLSQILVRFFCWRKFRLAPLNDAKNVTLFPKICRVGR